MYKRTKSLDKYFQDISKYSLLTADEEIELAIRKNNACRKSFDKLVRSNLRFVVQVARQYQNSGMALTDLIAEGNLGLIKAVGKFVIKKHYGLNCELPLILGQLGDKLGLTRERVRQNRDRALG